MTISQFLEEAKKILPDATVSVGVDAWYRPDRNKDDRLEITYNVYSPDYKGVEGDSAELALDAFRFKLGLKKGEDIEV